MTNQETIRQPAAKAFSGRGWGGRLFIILLFALATILVVIPVLMLVYASLTTELPFSGRQAYFTLGNYLNLWSPTMGRALYNTMIVSVGGTIMAMVIGAGLAWLAARTDVPFKPLLMLAGVLPLFVSLLVASVTWALLGSGRTGYLNILFSSLGLPFTIEMQSLAGITFVHGLYYVPFPFIFLYSALTLQHPDLEEAAFVHGAKLHNVLGTITFPLVKPALIGSMLLIFVLMAEEFPVPQILGRPVGIDTLSVRIYSLMSQIPNQPGQAAALSIVLIAIVCALVYTQRRALGGKDYRTVTGKGIQSRELKLGVWRWPAFALCGLYIFVAIGLPMAALIFGSLRSNLYIPNAYAFIDISQMSFVQLQAAMMDPQVQMGLRNSLLVGVLTAVFGGLLFFAIAYMVNRTKFVGRQYLEYIAMLPIAIPALVMGLGILWTWLAVPLPIYGTLAVLVIAYIGRFFPHGYRAIASSVQQVHDDLEEAAMVAGASRRQAVWHITLPLLRGGVVATVFLLLVLSVREVTATLFLYTTNTRVLSIVLFERYENGVWSSVASISLIYTAVLIVLTIVARRYMRAKI